MAEHIAKVTKQKAESEIDAKLLVLENWVAKGIPWRISDDGTAQRDSKGELMLEYFPVNIAQFSAWDGTQNTCRVLDTALVKKRTTRSTIYDSHAGAINRIRNVGKQLALQATKQLREANKTQMIGKLQDELLYLRQLTDIQANEITTAALESNAMHSELIRANRSVASLRERYDQETQQLRKKVAELTATLQKLMPLRKEDS